MKSVEFYHYITLNLFFNCLRQWKNYRKQRILVQISVLHTLQNGKMLRRMITQPMWLKTKKSNNHPSLILHENVVKKAQEHHQIVDHDPASVSATQVIPKEPNSTNETHQTTPEEVLRGTISWNPKGNWFRRTRTTAKEMLKASSTLAVSVQQDPNLSVWLVLPLKILGI